ncbi:hypothetical protein ATCC90586_002751 [Pythium insidiosum]|nr:hypothetical protein ATCC90586_002751 [Pythium insidiosum]
MERTVWRVTRLLGVVALISVAGFVLGSLRYSNLRANVVRSMNMVTLEAQSDSLIEILRVLPLLSWFFIGLESISPARDHAIYPSDALPKAMRMLVLLVASLSGAVFIVTASLPPGLRSTARASTPLTLGFVQFLSLDEADAGLLSLPAVFASAFGFTWISARHLTTLGLSGLLPAWLESRIHCGALVTTPVIVSGCALSLLVAALTHYTGRRHALVDVSVGFASLACVGQLAGFLSIRAKHDSSIQLILRSPFGAAGAVVSLMLWATTFVSVVALPRERDERVTTAAVIIGATVVLALYYALYASVAQVTSPGERELLHKLTQLRDRQARTNATRVTAVKPVAAMAVNKDGSLTMAELVQLGVSEGTFREETDLSEGTEVPYVLSLPLPRPQIQQIAPPPQAVGSSASVQSVTQQANRWSSGSFQRAARLERLKEETDLELRAAMSGIWSQRSRRFSTDHDPHGVSN